MDPNPNLKFKILRTSIIIFMKFLDILGRGTKIIIKREKVKKKLSLLLQKVVSLGVLFVIVSKKVTGLVQ